LRVRGGENHELAIVAKLLERIGSAQQSRAVAQLELRAWSRLTDRANLLSYITNRW
jgi:hypothetical protein